MAVYSFLPTGEGELVSCWALPGTILKLTMIYVRLWFLKNSLSNMRLFSVIVPNPLQNVFLGGLFYFPKMDVSCIGAAFYKLFDSCCLLTFYLEIPCYAFLGFTHCPVNRAGCLRFAETPPETGRNGCLAGCLDG